MDLECHSIQLTSESVLTLASVEGLSEFMIVTNIPESTSTTANNHSPKPKAALKTASSIHVSQFHQKKIQSSWSSSKRNLVEDEYHLKNNSLIMIEKYSNSSSHVMIFNSSGIISLQMIQLRSERFTSLMTEETVFQYTSEDKNCHRLLLLINPGSNSLVTDISPVMKLSMIEISLLTEEFSESKVLTFSRKITSCKDMADICLSETFASQNQETPWSFKSHHTMDSETRSTH